MIIFKDLIIFEMANSHQGSVEHGINIIKEMSKIAHKYNVKAAVKLQYRNLDTFIHPDFKGSKEYKHIDRFEGTRLTYDQGLKNSFYFSEELHITEESPKNIVVSDRATLFNLLIGLDGYTISSGVLSSDLNGENIVAIPLVSDEYMDIGYITLKDRPLNAITNRYIEHLASYIKDYSK
mgnify:CR=1 FL=1